MNMNLVIDVSVAGVVVHRPLYTPAPLARRQAYYERLQRTDPPAYLRAIGAGETEIRAAVLQMRLDRKRRRAQARRTNPRQP